MVFFCGRSDQLHYILKKKKGIVLEEVNEVNAVTVENSLELYCLLFFSWCCGTVTFPHFLPSEIFDCDIMAG